MADSSGEINETHLQSTSFPEATSVMMRRTHGGGVIGRRSYAALVNVGPDK
jgi:hypothetical protein